MPDRVSAFLTAQRSSRFCDDCIAESLELNRGDARKGSRALMTTDGFHRALGVCSMCGKEKRVIRRALRTEGPEAPEVYADSGGYLLCYRPGFRFGHCSPAGKEITLDRRTAGPASRGHKLLPGVLSGYD